MSDSEHGKSMRWETGRLTIVFMVLLVPKKFTCISFGNRYSTGSNGRKREKPRDIEGSEVQRSF